MWENCAALRVFLTCHTGQYSAVYFSLTSKKITNETFRFSACFRGLKSRTGDPELDSQLERKEKIEREEWQEERDDASLLQKRRNFDDYKDDHRRGSGNTIGKG